MTRRADCPDLTECGCGHPYHVGPCLGTGATLDPIYGVPVGELCVCDDTARWYGDVEALIQDIGGEA